MPENGRGGQSRGRPPLQTIKVEHHSRFNRKKNRRNNNQTIKKVIVLALGWATRPS
jgi:hypothetical protein